MTADSPEQPDTAVPTQRNGRVSRGREAFSKGLNRDDEERREHLAAIQSALNDPSIDKVHNWIHTNLIILDSKAQAILGLYSIGLAALTVYYATLGDDTPAIVVGAIVAGFLVIAWSIIPLARVSYVYWSSTEEFRDPQRLLIDLLRVRDLRTRLIRRSVLKGALTLAIFAFLLAWDIVHRLAR